MTSSCTRTATGLSLSSSPQFLVRWVPALILALGLQGSILADTGDDEEKHYFDCGYWTVTTAKTYGKDSQNYKPISGTRAYAAAYSDAGETRGQSETYEANVGWEAEARAHTTGMRMITSIFTSTEDGCEGWAKLEELEAKATGSIAIYSGAVAVAALTELTGTCSLTDQKADLMQDKAMGTSDFAWSASITVLGFTISYQDYTGGWKEIGPLYDAVPQAEACTDFVFTVCKGKVESYAKGDGWMFSPGRGEAKTEGKWTVALKYDICPEVEDSDTDGDGPPPGE